MKTPAGSRSLVLLLWALAASSVTCQGTNDCTREQFRNGGLFDPNFDISGMAESYPDQRSFRVPCAVGYTGFFKLICQKGQWASRGDPCQPRPCGHPGDAQFADFHLENGDDFVFGSKVVYTCQKGYQMVSRTNFRRCMMAGWSGAVPVCEARTCPPIDVDQNIQVVGDPYDAKYGNVVRFSCKQSRESLIGEMEIYCDEFAEWSSPPPKCEVVTCKPPNIPNGIVPRDPAVYYENEVLFFECNQNYQPVHDRPSKCTKLGLRAEWNPTPRCEEVTCKLVLTQSDKTSYEPPNKNIFSPHETVRVTCDDTHYIGNPKQVTAVATCSDKGLWSPDPVCQEVLCTRARPYGVWWWDIQWEDRLRMGFSARFSCRQGFKPKNHANEVTCTREGWTPSPPCEAINCDRLEIENAVITSQHKWHYRLYDQVTYRCVEGYEGPQRQSLECRENGWIGLIRCTEKACDKPRIEDASPKEWLRSQYQHSSNVWFSCNQNPAKKFVLTCQLGEWTGFESCTECSKPEIRNGLVVRIRDKAFYACEEGYKLPTTGWWAEATCINGMWSGIKYCLEDSMCREAPDIPNARPHTKRGFYTVNQTVSIYCNEGFQAKVANLTCEQGSWSSHGLSLKNICVPLAKPCGPPPRVKNAIVTDLYQQEFTSNTRVTYLCRPNYMMEQSNELVCINGSWEGQNITCTQYCEKPKDVEVAVAFIENRDYYLEGAVLKYQCYGPGAKKEGEAVCVDGEWNATFTCRDAAPKDDTSSQGN